MADDLSVHYRSYFETLRRNSGPLPEAEQQAFARKALVGIREHLEQHQFPPEEIAAHLSAARAESGLPPDSAAAPAISAPRRLALAGFVKRHPLPFVIAALSLLYVLCLAAFLSEGVPQVTVTGTEGAQTPMDIEFITVDLARDTATLFVLPDITSKAIARRGVLIEDIVVEIDAGDHVMTQTFKGGTAPIPWHVVVPFDQGDQLDYPFDRHSADITLRIKRNGDPSSVPHLVIDRIAHGFHITAHAQPTEDGQELGVDYSVRRSGSVIFVALFALLSLTLVCGAAVTVAWHVAVNGRKVEFGMLVWIAALLFVIPTVRNGLPGGPPHGALVDVGLIYWLHFLTVSALLGVVWAWTRHK